MVSDFSRYCRKVVRMYREIVELMLAVNSGNYCISPFHSVSIMCISIHDFAAFWRIHADNLLVLSAVSRFGVSPLTNSAKIFVNPCAGLPVKGRRDSNPHWGKTQQHLFRFKLCLLPVVILFGFEFVPHALAFQCSAIFLPVPSFDEHLTARLAERNIGFAAVVIQRIGIHRHKAGKTEISRIHHRFNHGL